MAHLASCESKDCSLLVVMAMVSGGISSGVSFVIYQLVCNIKIEQRSVEIRQGFLSTSYLSFSAFSQFSKRRVCVFRFQ